MWVFHSMRQSNYSLVQFIDHFGVKQMFHITFISKE